MRSHLYPLPIRLKLPKTERHLQAAQVIQDAARVAASNTWRIYDLSTLQAIRNLVS